MAPTPTIMKATTTKAIKTGTAYHGSSPAGMHPSGTQLDGSAEQSAAESRSKMNHAATAQPATMSAPASAAVRTRSAMPNPPSPRRRKTIPAAAGFGGGRPAGARWLLCRRWSRRGTRLHPHRGQRTVASLSPGRYRKRMTITDAMAMAPPSGRRMERRRLPTRPLPPTTVRTIPMTSEIQGIPWTQLRARLATAAAYGPGRRKKVA